MSLILSPKMASKRPSAADTVFPPKKRALYEHRKLHGIDQYSTNQIAANGMVPCQEKLGMVGLKLPINFVITEPENVSRTRSDSLNSHISSNSDNTETGSTESRETSPCTIQSMFDHQTPERNPITSLDGLKPDISKPLFPPSDSDNSMVDSEGHLSPDNSINDEQAESKADRYGRQEIIPSEESIENKSMSGKLDITIHNESQNSDVSDGLMEDMVKNNSVKQKQSEIYMGPMVSLLNRFNAEAVQNNISLKIKEHYSLEEMRNLVPSNSPFSDSAKANYAHTEVSSLPNSTQPKTLADNHDKNKVLSQIRSCHICSKDFTSVTSLQNHMKMHENKSIQCWVCKEKFQSADNLNTHMKLEHKGENPYKCEHCSREFTQFNNLRRHLRVHREKVFKCTLCNREFNEEFYLKMHMGTHTGKRIYSCGVCGSGFPSSHDLKMHVKTHSPSLLHTCDVCGKSFSKACVLRQHKKGHSGERPHKCDKCEKTFIHRHHLTMHMKSHVDEKQLSCNICQKEFSQHSHLYKHLRAHEDMKKYGLDLDSTQKSKNAVDSDPKRDDNQDHQVKQRSMPKVVTPNSVPLNEPNGMNNILVERMNHSNSKTTKQKRRHVSHDFQYQNSGSVNISSLPSVGNNHLMQSVTQQFTHQIGSLSSMHYSPEMSQKYLASSPARSFSPLINPLVRNGVPSLMHGYQSYNQLYRNYSEQMQAYYSNMYMMQYMSHNALLQKEHPESPNLLNNQNNLSHKQSENKNEQNRNEVKSNLMKPKFIHGVESLENEQKMDERKDVSRDDVQSDSDGNSEVDVVNATNEQTLEKQDFDFETRDIHEKHDDINVTEHEIAQELLKMSAGTKQSETFEDNSSNIEKGKIVEDNLKLQKEVEMKKKDDSKGLNFSHCVNDIIERTVRNSKSCVNKSMSNSHYVGANNNIPVYNDAIFGDELSVVIPKSTTLSSNTNEQERNNMAHLLVLGETIDSIDSGNAGARRTSESQASPLQKLEMFVTSEKNDFNKVEATVNESGGANQNFHGNFTEDLPQVESTYGVIDSQEETEGGNSETFDEYVALLKDRNEVNVVPKQTVSVEESLEMRLKKIQQFADIGMKLGNSVNDAFERKHDDTKDFKENIEDVSYNNTVTESKNIELNADIEIDEKESVEEINYYKKEVKEDTLLNDRKVLDKNDREGSEEVSKIDIVDNISGYFDDSLEDRQLEIVENDSYREETEDVKQIDDDEKDGITVNMGHGNEGDKEQGNESEINTDHELKEIKKTLHDSEGGYIFAENEFLKHISEMNDSKKANEEDKVEMDGKNMDREDEGKIVMGENKENSMLILTSLKESLRHENNFIHKLKELESNPSEVELKAKCSGINTIENGAMDLRTERTMNKVTGDVHANNTIQNIYQENLPIDLSLSRKWSDELDKLKAGERKTDRKYVRNSENGSPSCLLLTCGLCHRKFDDVSQLQSHQIEHAKEIGYCCNVCKKLFTGAFELQCHMLKHRNSEISFQSPNRPTVNNDFKCTEVSMLGSKEQYDKKENDVLTPSKFRERNEIGENQHSCKYCDKIFVEAEQLREHIHVHNGIKKPYVCNICRRAFVHRHNLNRHKMSHNSKSYKCDVCQRTFKESFYLQMHQKTHEEENYRMCQICGENVSKSEIWQHTSQHLGNITENPTYEQIGNRVQEILHEQDVNIDEAAWKNDNTRISHNILNTSEYGGDIRKLNSDEFCTNKKALNLRKENIENLSVTINDNAAITHSNIIQNKENLWNCSPVSPKNGFEGVYRNSGSKMYQMLECHICKVVLSTKHELENHMGIHSGLRPHVCKICGRAFKKSKGLKTHEKIHLESSYNV